SDGGTNWTAPDTVPGILVVNDFQSNINLGPQPKISVDSKSNTDTTFIYLLWADNATGLIQINLARSLDFGQTFTDLGIVDNNLTNVNRNPYLVVDDSGWVHCTWARGTGGTNQDPHPWIGYNRSEDHGINFMPADLIVNDDSGGVYRGNPSVTYNILNGNVIVSWEDSRRAGGNANPDIWFSRMHRDSTSFSLNQRVNWWSNDSSATYDCFKPATMMDPTGIMVAAWHDDPERDGSFGIHIAAYLDSLAHFSNSQSLINTFTGTSGASFGSDFYSPSLFVTLIDTITNFFLVWQDFYEDSLGGNIYSVHGWVVASLADIDVDNDSLDVVADTMDLRTQPAGPAYAPYAKGIFMLANTDTAYNPDPGDGPSSSSVDSFSYYGSLTGPGGTIDSVFVIGLPATMPVGMSMVCTLAVVLPVNTPEGAYSGSVTITARDSLGGLAEETFAVKVYGPQARSSLDSLRVVPIPFKPNSDPEHDRIHFQGLTDNATVYVYDLSGALVWSETETDGDGHLEWDARVGSGIYIYLVTTPNGDGVKGKLSVIR
ncbi:MAG: T9SS type A sorting domain-containing protein, partial [candidate division WOR-3 bacterium]